MENTHLVFYPEASEFSKNTYEFEKWHPPCRMYR
mgnify:CR=1 FL=1